MNDDFFALVDTDALKALSGQPSASGAAMLLVDTHGLIRAQTAAASELLELENGDLLASALSDEAVALVEDCASGGGANSMTEHLDVGDCRLTVVPHPDGALVALAPQPLRLPRGLSYVCGDTLNASIARLYDLAAKASDPALAAALSREMFRLQRMAFHVTELLDPPVFGTINAHDCELSRLCSDVADQILRRLPEDRRDCIMTSVPMRCSSYVDAVRLRAALYNLLLNAVAVSSDPGSVTFTLTCETRPAFEDETIEYAVMTVCDKGPGLSPERFRSAVSAWCTSMSARERMRLTASGMQPGLGLAFAQLVAQAHEGTLTCAQRPGGGTEMRLAIPLFEPRAARSVRISSVPCRSRTSNSAFYKKYDTKKKERRFLTFLLFSDNIPLAPSEHICRRSCSSAAGFTVRRSPRRPEYSADGMRSSPLPRARCSRSARARCPDRSRCRQRCRCPCGRRS